MKSRGVFISSHAFLLLMCAGLGVAGALAPSLEQRVDRYLEPYLDIGHLSGTLLIARGSEVLYEKSFGLAHHELGVPNTPRTRFGVGSINKPMTIVILARLLELEKVALEDNLSKFLPDFPRGGEITIGDLLRHSAGIPHRVTSPLDETRPQTPASMVELAAQKELVFEPGTDSVYSSAGFSVLARVLELAGEKRYADLLEEYVLKLAGMTETSDAGTRAILERRAASYYFDTGGLINAPPSDISYLIGAGSVFSTPRDLLAMQRALLAGKLGQRAAAGEDVPPPSPINAKAADVDANVLESYQGSYELRPGRNLELRVVNGRVQMNDWLLIPTSKTTLFSPQDYAEIEVVLGEDGEVSRLDWTTGGQTYPLPRVGPVP